MAKIFNHPRIKVRYFTGRFHAKIYVFDDAAMLGSANLTQAGLAGNREAVACFDNATDPQAVDDVRSLFQEFWDSADVLTEAILKGFKLAWVNTVPTFDRDKSIADAVGVAEPKTISVQKQKNAVQRLFLQNLRRKINEQYRPAFDEIGRVLAEARLERGTLSDLARPFHTNRFLNWVRLTHAPGEDIWHESPVRDEAGRRTAIIQLGKEWCVTSHAHVPADYDDRLKTVEKVFTKNANLLRAQRDDLTGGLMSIHAFTAQYRFVTGGMKALPVEFWRQNNNDQKRVVASLDHLLFGSEDFVERLHDIVYSPRWKLKMFGLFCATELAGTVRPDECPPVNGRSAKAMRFIGFDVSGQ